LNRSGLNGMKKRSRALSMSSLQSFRGSIAIARHFSPMPRAEMDRLTSRLPGEDSRFAQFTHPECRDGQGLLRQA